MNDSKQIYTVQAVHFRPYAETGEFACIGVLIYSRKSQYLNCRFAEGDQLRHVRSRLHGFFPELSDDVFQNTIRYVKEELKRVNQTLRQGDLFRPPEWMIQDFLKPRENVICLGPGTVVLCDDPEKELGEQFKRIVMRGFIDSKGTYLQKMRKSIQTCLQTARIQYRTDFQIPTKYAYEIRIPFAPPGERPEWALKPLDLSKDKAQEVIDQIVKWKYQAEQIANAIGGIKILRPTRFAAPDTPSYEAAKDMVNSEATKGIFGCCPYSDSSDDGNILSFLKGVDVA